MDFDAGPWLWLWLLLVPVAYAFYDWMATSRALRDRRPYRDEHRPAGAEPAAAHR